MALRYFTVLLVIEFLIALIAVFTVWSQVGGQYHLDLMGWYWKLGFSLATAAAIVRLTVELADGAPFTSLRAQRWILILALLMGAAGAVTYYYHLYEPADEEDSDQTSVTNAGISASPNTSSIPYTLS